MLLICYLVATYCNWMQLGNNNQTQTANNTLLYIGCNNTTLLHHNAHNVQIKRK